MPIQNTANGVEVQLQKIPNAYLAGMVPYASKMSVQMADPMVHPVYQMISWTFWSFTAPMVYMHCGPQLVMNSQNAPAIQRLGIINLHKDWRRLIQTIKTLVIFFQWSMLVQQWICLSWCVCPRELTSHQCSMFKRVAHNIQYQHQTLMIRSQPSPSITTCQFVSRDQFVDRIPWNICNDIFKAVVPIPNILHLHPW